jgi:hypothetical protein
MDMLDNPAGTARAPFHMWIVAGLGLLWNGLGCYEYIMTNVRDAHTISHVPADMIDYLDALPAWVIIAWAMVVGCGLLGSLLLLGRSLWAAYAFAVSLLGLVCMQAYQLLIGLPSSVDTTMTWLSIGLVWLAALAQLLYASRMRANLVLR